MSTYDCLKSDYFNLRFVGTFTTKELPIAIQVSNNVNYRL